MRILLEEHGWSFAPQPQEYCFFQHTYRQAWSCPSQHSVGKGNLADHAADQEAQRDGDDDGDPKFEQRVERDRVQAIRETDQDDWVKI